MRHLHFSLIALSLLATSHAVRGDDLTLDNGRVRFASDQLRDLSTGKSMGISPAQGWLQFADGGRAIFGSLVQVGATTRGALPVTPSASRVSERLAGTFVEQRFVDATHHLAILWRAELRAGSRYLRVSAEVINHGTIETPLAGLGLLNMELAGASTLGEFNGSPIVADTAFLGVEHPLAQNRVVAGRVQGMLPWLNALRPGETARASAVLGFTDAGQLRRDFLTYLERERAHPYRPFLHHNTWYNIGYFTPFTQDDLMGVIRAFEREMVTKRGVKMDAFVLDDGWDDPKTLWKFHSGFPQGLKPASELAAQAGAGMGIWLSPWGGYGNPKKARLEYGTAAGFETREGSFSLAGPRYFERFRALCTDVLANNHVAYFKFDGIGSKEGPDRIDPTAGRDFEAMMRLIAELRAISPDVFVNQTTGTWPSPFWLLQVDSIWRGGNDHQFLGVGSARQRWITYRDANTYKNIVRRGPLYPLNSLMIHGIIYATKAKDLQTDPGNDFTSEIRSYFGSGTQLQELYVSPELLSQNNWDDLAAAARWSRENSATLLDTHWVGGDPNKLEVYGWAAWSPKKGVLTLRNPGDKTAAFPADVEKLFELPVSAPRTFKIVSAYADAPSPITQLRAGESTLIELPPFAVLVLEATPQ